MAINLVSLVMQFLTPDMIGRIATALGVDRNIAQAAASAVVPALLAGFSKTAAQPGGAQKLVDAARQQSGTLGNFANMLGTGGQSSLIEKGSQMLSTLLGGQDRNSLAQAVRCLECSPLLSWAPSGNNDNRVGPSMQAASPTSSRAKKTILPRHCRQASATYLAGRACSMRSGVQHGPQQPRVARQHRLQTPRFGELAIPADVRQGWRRPEIGSIGSYRLQRLLPC